MESGILLDISAQGAGIQVVKPMQPGLRLGVSFQLPDSDISLQPTYEVVWATPDGRVGLKFLYTAEAEHHRLCEWLAVPLRGASELSADELSHQGVPQPGNEAAQLWEAPSESVAAAPAGGPHSQIEAPQDLKASSDFSALPRIESDLSAHAEADAADVELAALLLELAGLRPEAALAQAVQYSQDSTDADGAAIALRAGDAVVCRATAGNAPEIGVEIDQNSGLSGECLRTAKVVHCIDALHDSRVDAGVAELLHLRSVLVVPIVASNEVSGFVEVFSSRPSVFTSSHVATLRRIASVIASGVVTESATVHDYKEFEAAHTRAVEPTDDARSRNSPPQADPLSGPERIASIVGLLDTELTPSGISFANAVSAPSLAALPFAEPISEFAYNPTLERPSRLHRIIAACICVALVGAIVWVAHFFLGTPGTGAVAATPIAASGQATADVPGRTQAKQKTNKGTQSDASIEPLRVPAAFMERRVISNPRVEYHQYQSDRLPAPVVLEVLVGSDGRVAAASYVSGDQTLARAAIETLKRWKYQPYFMNGKAIPIISVVTVKFKSAAQ